jgi:hypothetical protein
MATSNAWVQVPLETAKRHPLYGIGGWLILVMLGQFLSPLMIVIGLYPIYQTLDFSELPPAYAAFVVIELALNAVFGLWAWSNLWLIFNKRALAVKSVIGFLALSPAFLLSDALAAKFMLEYVGGTMSWQETFDAETMRAIGRSFVGAAIWIPYMVVSQRVNVTLLNRVRSGDPLAADAAFG